ncbi:hypothetical protein IC608_09105 [Devosia sp. PTR5]|uniref:Uncharacterized protein n=1 Tax=Devosia oryzisoli TaxID=2774138 RepID=A0A927FVK4_9HYPH|nr:hypothetical protein [Devosia oryzisoli]MBD8065633.1 hypothetical protein [Devosia oryzisoli]
MRHSHARPRRYRTLWPPAEGIRVMRTPSRPAYSPERARLAVAVALRDGRIERGPCEVCEAAEGVEAYIANPAQPFALSWRCPTHMPR